jgi:mRNA-degrading endonuclease toxin of MazEF toxin-antitoxin module
MVKYTPKSGDIVWLEFDPQKGKEIQKTRPALTISKKLSKSTILIYAVTTSKVGFRRLAIASDPACSALVATSANAASEHLRSWCYIQSRLLAEFPIFEVVSV